MEQENKKYKLKKPSKLRAEKAKKFEPKIFADIAEESDGAVLSALDTFPTRAALGLYLRHIKDGDV